MAKHTKSGGTKKTGTSSNPLPSNVIVSEIITVHEESNGETYKEYPGSPNFLEGTIPEFKDVTDEERQLILARTTSSGSNLNETYKTIEKIITQWCNDGTKTAGRLTRRILIKLIQDDQKGKTG